jgi:hypothetical protein
VPYTVQLRRKNVKAVEAIMGVALDNPQVGQVIELPMTIKAKITAIVPTSAGAAINQSVVIIEADEI